MNTEKLDKYTVTQKGMRLLRNILLSSPACKIKNSELLKNDLEMSLEKIYNDLSIYAAITIYGYLILAGIEKEINEIDFDTIVLAFADKNHTNSANDNIVNRSMSVQEWQNIGFDLENQKQKIVYVFGHTLTKAKIIAQEQDGFWRAQMGKFIVKGLYAPRDLRIEKGQTVFVHFATIVATEDSLEPVKISDFSAGLNHKIIDYRTVFGRSLSDWTKKNFEEKLY